MMPWKRFFILKALEHSVAVLCMCVCRGGEVRLVSVKFVHLHTGFAFYIHRMKCGVYTTGCSKNPI